MAEGPGDFIVTPLVISVTARIGAKNLSYIFRYTWFLGDAELHLGFFAVVVCMAVVVDWP